MSEGVMYGKKCPGEGKCLDPHVGLQFPMRSGYDFAIMVNIQTHIQTAFDQLYY